MKLEVDVKLTRTPEPIVVDDDEGIISVMVKDRELHAWCYDNDDERRDRMRLARAYADGWSEATERIFSFIDGLIAAGIPDDEKH